VSKSAGSDCTTNVAAALEGLAALGQFDEHLTLVSGIADALDEPRRLHPLRPPHN
jgi:hypothetical protein